MKPVLKESKKALNNVRLANRIRVALLRALPDIPVEVAAAIAVDLSDIYFLFARHRERLARLLALDSPSEMMQISEIATGIEVDLLTEVDYHLKSLRKLLPKLLNPIERQSKRKQWPKTERV